VSMFETFSFSQFGRDRVLIFQRTIAPSRLEDDVVLMLAVTPTSFNTSDLGRDNRLLYRYGKA
jgi:hypothetical protein